jgi:hypothetical protein
MKSKLTYLLPIISLISGFILALLAAGVHSTFFMLVPIMAFIMGYFTSWGRGLVCSILLFSSYTFTIALMWEVRYAFVGISQYFGAFFGGGFAILLLGALAPLVRNGIKKVGAIIVLVLLIVAVAGCSYLSIPRYSYNFGLNIMCTQNTELLIPTAAASGDLAERLLKSTKSHTSSYGPDWYEVQLQDTQYGQIWHLKMYSHLTASPDPRQPGRGSSWYMSSDEIRSWPRQSPVNMFQLYSKHDSRTLDKVVKDNISWPSIITADRILEEFSVPVKVQTDNTTEFEIDMYYSVSKTTGINFGYGKEESYSQRVMHSKGTTGNEWIMLPMEAIHGVSIRGMGD